MKPSSIEPVQMWQDSAPINSTVQNYNSGTAARNTLTVASAQTVTFSTECGSLEFVPSAIPSAPIFIKWGNTSGQLTASATVFDEILTPCKPAIQVGVTPYCNSYSIFSWTSQTVYTIER